MSRKKWNIDMIKSIVKDNTIVYSVDLRQINPSAYSAAIRNGWLNQLGLKHKNKTSKYTYEDAYNAAKKYKHIKDFRKENKVLYGVSVKNDWISSFDWFERDINPYENNVDCCYMYINYDKRIVYVGRTINKDKRDYDHRNMHNSNLKRYFLEYGCEIPEPIYYMDTSFPVEYGLFIEDKLVKWFKENGWTVLNKAKTGVLCGALGSTRRKWNKNKIDKAAEECNYDLTLFANKYRAAYRVMNKMGYNPGFILKKKPNGYWNDKNKCEAASKECHNRSDFAAKYSMAYLHSRENGWIDEFFPNKKGS